MEDSKAVAFYDDQRSRGSGAAKFKHGLGFAARPPPTHQIAPDSFSSRPGGPPPMLRSPIPSQRPAIAPPYLHSCGPQPQPPFYPPVVYPPPPGPYSAQAVLPSRIGVPMMPPRPPARPPQGLPFYPPPRVLLGPEAWQPVPPPRPPMGPPPPRTVTVAGAASTGANLPQNAQTSPLTMGPIEGKPNGLDVARLSEGPVTKRTENLQRSDDDVRKRKENQSWSAHKADDGAVYYYNTLTNKSSWEKPEGFVGGDSSVTETPKPVASARIKGCDWIEVKCADGRKYFFHVISQETLWSEPPEVTRIKSAEEESLKAQNAPQQPRSGSAAAKTLPSKYSRPSSPPKKPPAPKPQQLTEDTIAGFKALLEEKGINPFSCFEKEMPKLEQDERWKEVPSLKDKRVFFDEYCRSLAERQRQNKEDATKAAANGFLDLLDAIAEHEIVQQAERKRRKAADREEGEMETGDSSEEPDVSTTGFPPKTTMELLETFWGNDERWKACSPRTRRRLFEERRGPVQQAREPRHKQALHIEENFRAMLQDHKVGSSSRWSKMKGVLLQDDRFTAVLHSEREELFRKYVEETKTLEEQERRKQREQLVKEREVRVRIERDEEEAERRKQRASHIDAVAGFRTLLGEVVKDPDAMWRDWKNKLEKDSQGRATNLALEPRELERLFRDHVKELMDVAIRDYRELLKEVVRPLFPSKEKHSQSKSSRDHHPSLHSFESAQDLLQDDPRFQRTPKGIRERLWRRFVEDVFLEYAPSIQRGESERPDRHVRNRESSGYRPASQKWHSERNRQRVSSRSWGRDRTRTYYREREDSQSGQERKRSRA